MAKGNIFVETCNIHPSWQAFFEKSAVNRILANIEIEISDSPYYPECKNVLRFASNDLDQIKHVIVGMDPYPSFNIRLNKPQATGRSFEVSELEGESWDYKIKQSSLRNILKAIYFNETGKTDDIANVRANIADGTFTIADPTTWFDAMESQGVVFLNSTLTVKPGEPGSHKEMWTPFREYLAEFLSGRDISWHLWGKDAQSEYGDLLDDRERKLQAPHPRMSQFVSNNTFQYADDIDWTGMNYPNANDRLIR